MITWNESIKMRIYTEEDEAELEFETDGEQRTYIYLKEVGNEEKPRKYIGAVDTVDFVRIMARALTLWRDDAEEVAALEEEATVQSKNISEEGKPE
jgi:hypothetical protein